MHEQLRRWKAAGEASAAAAAAIQRVCGLQPVVDDERGEWRMGGRVWSGGGVLVGEADGGEEREEVGEVDPGLFLIGDDEDEDEGDGWGICGYGEEGRRGGGGREGI